MPFYHWRHTTLVLSCHLQPGARHDAIVGEHGGRLKIRLRAPPVDGKANAALVQFIADTFGVSRQQVTITAGASDRRKTLAIENPQTIPDSLGIHR